MVECTRLESEQTVKGLGSSNLPLSVGFDSRSIVRYFAAFLFAIATMRGACASNTSAIHGTVRDGQSGTALANTEVFVHGDDAREIRVSTDARGRFSVVGLPGGRIEVDVPAFDAYSTDRLVCDLATSEDGRFDFYLWAPNLPDRDFPSAYHVPSYNSVIAHPNARTSHCNVEPSTSDLYIIR